MIKDKACWRFRQSKNENIQELSNQLNLSPVMTRILMNRGITSNEIAKKFLNTDVSLIHQPFLLKDMDKAVSRIILAIKNKEKICVYGDYDVDGAVATSILILFFQSLEIQIDYYIPNRITEGYSINKGSIKTLKERQIDLVITVDNGVAAHEAIDYANELGIDVVITDHHQVKGTSPNAVAVVNPQQVDCSYPFKGICGATVAYKLVMALRHQLREDGFFQDRQEPNLKQFIDLVCIATICDVVPLVDENRYFVKEGLRLLKDSYRLGLRELLKVCDLLGKDQLSTYDVGFKLGPRINACGRLKNADLGVVLLTTEDRVEAAKQASLLDYINRERQKVELKIVTDVFERIEKEVDLNSTLGLVLYDPDWHVGVVGIVASRVAERYHRPVFILCRDEQGQVKGSGRSISTVNLIACLNDSKDHLTKYGGHEAAAGVTLTEGALEGFQKAFDVAVKKQMCFEDAHEVLLVDEDLTDYNVDWPLLKELTLLEPHGVGNAKPVFVSSNLAIRSKRVVGRNHLQLTVSACGGLFKAIAFNKAEDIDLLGDRVGAVFGLEVNRFRDQESIQLVIKEFFHAGA